MIPSGDDRLPSSVGAVPAPTAAADSAANAGDGHLVRGLGFWGATLLTVGSIVGTGIFLTTSDMARVLPHSGLILLVWLAGGLFTLAGALTYAELGVMFPRAGGQYQYLKEAYGPFWGFLFGWSGFLVGMSGGNAAIAVGFGEYLGGFLPFFSTRNVLLEAPIGGWQWTLSGGQVAAALAIVALTAINHVGLRAGAGAQNVLTMIKLAAMVGLVVFGLTAAMPAATTAAAAAPSPVPAGGALLAAFGVAMIAALWTYDGWYGLTCAAGEVRDPARNVPRGLIGGTAVVVVLYLLLNVVYFRALPMATIAETPRVAEAAAGALFGPFAARLMAAAVLVSSFGCLSASLLYTSRIYQPMAADGLFFRAVGRVDPRRHVPVVSLWAQGAWAVVLALSGTYDQLYTYAVFSLVLFHLMTAVAVIVLRRRRPEVPRPYRTWGYPVVPVLFIAACLLLVGNTLFARPVESLLGVLVLVLGVPAYLIFRRRNARTSRAQLAPRTRSARSSSSSGSVLRTSSARSQPRRAWSTPQRRLSSSRVRWASVETTTRQPSSRARRSSGPWRSSRSGEAFASTATPRAAALREDRLPIGVDGSAHAEPPRAGVGEDGDARVVEGAQVALRLRLARQLEPGVDGGEQQVERR